ncbi:MAG: hypothetical protein LC708_00105, partial [Actinobacteria bacterium]|nr:hypothetical protein [Actinomycetota bacterium]
TQASPTISTLASAGGPVGTAVNDVATVSGGASPTGTVTFQLFSDAACTVQVFTSTNPVVAGTATSGNFTPAGPGTYHWVATYSGDANNTTAGPTACLDPAEDVTITQASPTISTQASAGGPVGTAVNDVATVSGGLNPTGTVTFQLFSDAACTNQVFTSTNPVVAGTATSSNFTPTSVGVYRWVATYSGDANHTPAGPTACLDPAEDVEITQATPTISTQASAGGPVGTSVNDVATISGGASPTGTVTFALFSDAACTVPVFSSTNPVVAGTATSGSFTPAGPGTYRWVATYSGDANNAAAGPTACLDPDEDVTITQAQPTIVTQAASSSSVTATSPASITDTATLAGGVNPTGTVTFALFGPDNATCAGTPVFTSTKPVTGNGTYVSDPFTTAALGAYRWVVTYSGDANNLGATSPCNAPNETSEVTVVCSAVPTAGTLPGNTIVVAQPGVITTGTPGNDVIYGTAGDDRIDGAGGNDVIFGGGGRDQLTGGEGDDTVCGGEGNDQLVGSAGNDLLSGDAGNDDLAGVAGNDRLIGGPGVNRLSGGDGVDACSPGPDPASQAASCETAVV